MRLLIITCLGVQKWAYSIAKPLTQFSQIVQDLDT